MYVWVCKGKDNGEQEQERNREKKEKEVKWAIENKKNRKDINTQPPTIAQSIQWTRG